MRRRSLNLLTWLAVLLNVGALLCFTYSMAAFAVMQSAAALLYFYAALLGHLDLRRAARARDGLCPACGYDVHATPGRCPECGATPT